MNNFEFLLIILNNFGQYSREACLRISNHDIFSKTPFISRANIAADYSASMEQVRLTTHIHYN